MTLALDKKHPRAREKIKISRNEKHICRTCHIIRPFSRETEKLFYAIRKRFEKYFLSYLFLNFFFLSQSKNFVSAISRIWKLIFIFPIHVEWKRERHWKIEKPCFGSEGTGEKGDIKAKHLGSLSIRSRVNKNLVDRNPIYFSHKLLLFVIFAVLSCRGRYGGVVWDVSERQSTFGRERVSIVFVCDRIVSEKQIFFL